MKFAILKKSLTLQKKLFFLHKVMCISLLYFESLFNAN